MYENSQGNPHYLGNYGGLGEAWAKDSKKLPVKPEALLPGKKKELNYFAAMQLVQRSKGLEAPPEKTDKVYWKTDINAKNKKPVYSLFGKKGADYFGPATEAKTAKYVTPPPIKNKKVTKIVKDRAPVTFPPIEIPSAAGFGAISMQPKTKILAVLGLLLLGAYLYNSKPTA